jgi:hypothetical protein
MDPVVGRICVTKLAAAAWAKSTTATRIRIFHFMDQPPFPCTPIVISRGRKFNTEVGDIRASVHLAALALLRAETSLDSL